MITADLVLYNGNIITIDATNTMAQASAGYKGNILKIGTDEDVLQLCGTETKKIDLNGKSVITGLIDSNSHIIAQGIIRNLYLDLSEDSGIRSISDIQEKIRKKAENLPEGTWIIGYQEDDSKLVEKRHPTRWELDKASDKHRIMVETIGGHFRIVNSYAFESAGVNEETNDPIGGKFDRDQDGILTGGIHEKAIELISPSEKPISDEMAYRSTKEILEEAVAQGLTCIYECAINYLANPRTQIKTALDLKNNDELPIRIRFDITIE
ncbi:MAG: amidohydrolase family protein, partial [Candidatus Heimdallarchaeota archaeon]|nr:amidohydrolase family protein [Candidatus Heimdallarchaeota archaeon]